MQARFNLGRHSTQWEIEDEARAFYLPTLNPATGQQDQWPATIIPPLPHFFTLCRWESGDDADFHRQSDQSWLMVWFANADLGFTHLNRNFVSFVGRPLADILGFSWPAIVHPGDQPWILAALEESSRKRESFQHLCRIRHNGEWDCVLNWGIPYLRRDQTFAGYVGTLHPIPPLGSPFETAYCDGQRWHRKKALIVPTH